MLHPLIVLDSIAFLSFSLSLRNITIATMAAIQFQIINFEIFKKDFKKEFNYAFQFLVLQDKIKPKYRLGYSLRTFDLTKVGLRRSAVEP